MGGKGARVEEVEKKMWKESQVWSHVDLLLCFGPSVDPGAPPRLCASSAACWPEEEELQPGRSSSGVPQCSSPLHTDLHHREEEEEEERRGGVSKDHPLALGCDFSLPEGGSEWSQDPENPKA
ncbi:Hypothetical predicted protein [Xyrichtys novacula]|uniref:Uncharacterized protein n=1 Tax=Xyrichtys novacula TaxID=13765 RepID=A0AAV1FE99_XYRNO|nr:Hypothetical predicted protein [Xyrichtys novacula]